MNLVRALVLPLSALALAPWLSAQEEVKEGGPLAGHSSHGVAFNEGPRQQAYLMEGCGDVHFPVTCKNDLAQRFFDQGVGQLHGFWHFEAERSFRQVAKIDPECAMAYWGMAMANVDNPDRAAGFMEEAVRRREQATARERTWIESLAEFYEVTPESAAKAAKVVKTADASAKKRKFKASKKNRSADLAESYEQIVEAYPDDIEAIAFLVNRVWLNRRARISTKNYDRMESLLRKVFAKNPNHPAHHYRIHLWDRKDAKRALVSAAVSGQVSPAVAHQWHMSGHIFAKLHRHEDAVWQQSASARVDHAHMMRDGVMPYQIHNFGHNNEWLTRSMTHVGRVRDAIRVAKNMVEMPRHPEKNKLAKRSSIAGYGRTKLIEAMRKYLLLDDLRALDAAGYFEGDNGAASDLAQAYFTMGDVERGKKYMALAKAGEPAAASKKPADKLTKKPAKKTADKPAKKSTEKPAATPVKKPAKTAKPKPGATSPRDKRRPGWRERATARRSRSGRSRGRTQDMEGLLALAEGRLEDAKKKLRRSRMSKLYLADVRLALGQKKEARRLIDAEAKRLPNRAEIMARQVRIHAETGDEASAKKIFDALRTVAGTGDIDTPLFQRLAGLAEKFGYPKDWRTPAAPAEDAGERPDLDELGPLCWSPGKALDWELPSADGSMVRLSDAYKGKPVLVVFYLGFGCLHCVEQLQAFHPMTAAFKEAGIDIVAVGTDSVAGARKSLQDLSPVDRFQFPLLCDPKMKIFKEWRAFDDFEDMPLHGTFLIDAEGYVRWQDISYEPFNKPKWLLAECKRLLALKQTAQKN